MRVKYLPAVAVLLTATLLLANQCPGPWNGITGKFQLGDIVKVSNTAYGWVNVRDDAGGNVTARVPDDWVFTILSGPRVETLEGEEFTWWRVQSSKYEVSASAPSGWVAENFLGMVSVALVPSKPPAYFVSGQSDVEAAVRYAQDHVGSMAWYEAGMTYCLRFTRNAYDGASLGWTSANDAVQQLGNSFYAASNSWNPPKGALVFFSVTDPDFSTYGHVGLYLGGGDVAHVSGAGPVKIDTLGDVVNLSYIGEYLGWAYPPEEWLGVSAAQGKIAFASERDGNGEIYVMNADGSDQRNLTNHPAADWRPVWSSDGTKIAFVSNRDGNDEVYVMNADGSNQRNLTNHPAVDWQPAWSPDGTKIAFASNRDETGEIYVMNADGSGQRNLTNHHARDWYPAWSPDGTKIAFASDRDGNVEIYVMNADGSDQRNLTNHPAVDARPAWSPDGTKIAFSPNRDGNFEIYVMNADGSDQRRLTNHPAYSWHSAWSPDGTKIAFVSNRDGNDEIYVMNADGRDQRRLTNHPAGDEWPAWSPVLP